MSKHFRLPTSPADKALILRSFCGDAQGAFDCAQAAFDYAQAEAYATKRCLRLPQAEETCATKRALRFLC